MREFGYTPMAQYGRIFKDAGLQSYFDGQWWYVRNPNYKDSMLTKEERDFSNAILEYEKGLK